MRRFPITLSILLLGVVAFASTQEQEQQQTPPADLLPAPRVVGQPQTQAEADDWQALQQAPTPEEQIRLAEQFLSNYPNSGLMPFVYYRLANLYQQSDPEKFILYGEEALKELPLLPDLLAYLAFFYAEKGQGALAVERAQAAMEALNTVPKPPSLSEAGWVAQKYELSGESHYALGRVELAEAMGQSGEEGEQRLANAVRHLEQALEQKPNHSYAAFRLAEAHARRKDYEQAINIYARTVAMGGVIGDFARRNLEKFYQHVHQNTEGMEEVIRQQEEVFQQAMETRRQELEKVSLEEQEASETTIVKPPM